MLYYLASPYSGTDEEQEDRWLQIATLVDRLRRIGVAAYSPIALWHPIAKKLNLPNKFTAYAAVDYEMIRRCDGFVIVPLDGWLRSAGTKDEWICACACDKPYGILNTRTLRVRSIAWKSWPTEEEIYETHRS